MNKRMTTVILSIVLAVMVIAGVSAYAASNYGTASDPLVAMSYLTDVLTPQLEKGIEETVRKAIDEVKAYFSSASGGSAAVNTYKAVTLSNGQTLKGAVGCEIILREGTASCKASAAPGLVDVTSGGTINNGAALTENHLYMVTAADNGITAGASTVKVLVRGGYTVN